MPTPMPPIVKYPGPKYDLVRLERFKEQHGGWAADLARAIHEAKVPRDLVERIVVTFAEDSGYFAAARNGADLEGARALIEEGREVGAQINAMGPNNQAAYIRLRCEGDARRLVLSGSDMWLAKHARKLAHLASESSWESHLEHLADLQEQADRAGDEEENDDDLFDEHGLRDGPAGPVL